MAPLLAAAVPTATTIHTDNDEEILSRGQMRALRELAQVSFREIAVVAGVSAGWLCGYEQGRARLRPEQLRKIKALLVSQALRREQEIRDLVESVND